MTRVTSPQKYDGGQPHGLVYRPDDIEEHASAVLLAKDIADYLEKEYNGWLWAIEVNSKGGTFNIRSLRLSGEWGYVGKLAWVDDPVARKRIVLAGAGEILERYGMKAGTYNHEAWANGPRDLAGRPKPDLSDKRTKVQRRARDEALTQAVKDGEVTVRYEDSHLRDGSRHRRILIASAPKREGPNARRR
jgi:hypothetical protein